MEFFQLKKKNTFQQFSCPNCGNFSTHSNEESERHLLSCRGQKEFCDIHSNSQIPFGASQSQGCSQDVEMTTNYDTYPTSSLEHLAYNYCGSGSDEKFIINENINLQKLHESNRIQMPLMQTSIPNSLRLQESFQMSSPSVSRSQTTNNAGNTVTSQNNSLIFLNGFNNLNINNPDTNNYSEFQGKMLVISPTELRDRKEKNRKCITCNMLKVGDLVTVFDCHDVAHLYCFSEKLLSGPCPICKEKLHLIMFK
jgi:predicted RNA-binding Zn-ribbon protein involved in translation (DUF1610 family)